MPSFNSKLWRHEVGRQLVGGDKFRINYTSITMHCCAYNHWSINAGLLMSICIQLMWTGLGLPGLWRLDWLSCPEGVWLHGSDHSVRQRGGPSGSPGWRHQQAPCAGAGASHIPRGLLGQPCEAETAHSAHQNQTKPRPHFSHYFQILKHDKQFLISGTTGSREK